jgi:polygalacturonase
MLSYVTNVTVSGITIYTVPASGQSVAFNTVGVDISAAQHVYFNNNNITCGDDNVVTEGYYIDVENCTFGVGHGCSIGSYTTAGVAFVTVHNCTFSGTTSGIRMKSERDRGGDVQYLAYNNNTMTGVGTPVSITSYYPSDPPNPTTNATQTVTSTTPIWKHIKIQTLTATGSANCGSLYGLPEEAITDMTFNNVKISGTTGLKIYFANAIVFTNGSSITPSSGNAVTIYKATVTGITTHNYP